MKTPQAGYRSCPGRRPVKAARIHWDARGRRHTHDLVFEDHVVSPCVPGQLRDETVGLVPVVVVVGQNEVRHEARLKVLEGFLDELALKR